jgi:hypothetical protein
MIKKISDFQMNNIVKDSSRRNIKTIPSSCKGSHKKGGFQHVSRNGESTALKKYNSYVEFS